MKVSQQFSKWVRHYLARYYFQVVFSFFFSFFHGVVKTLAETTAFRVARHGESQCLASLDESREKVHTGISRHKLTSEVIGTSLSSIFQGKIADFPSPIKSPIFVANLKILDFNIPSSIFFYSTKKIFAASAKSDASSFTVF